MFFLLNLPQIPAMAVEMPGSTDISGLNLQFGALQFGSEPVLPEYESAPTTTTPVNQVQNSLYTSPSRLVHSKKRPYTGGQTVTQLLCEHFGRKEIAS